MCQNWWQGLLRRSIVLLQVDQASLGLDREYLIQGMKNEVVKAYYNYLVDLAIMFGADRSTAEKEITDALDFEIALAEISLTREERRNVTALTNPMPVAEIQTRYPSIPWQEFFNNLADVPEVTVCPQDMADVGVLDYLTKLEKLLEKTPKRVQANYLLYRTLTGIVTYLTKEVRDRELKYKEVSEGISEHTPRWRECTELVATKLNLAADALYVRRYFNEDAKRNAEDLVTNLRKTFIEMLKQVDWMDGNTKKKALEKALAIESHVAYPQELLDDNKLNEYYSKLNPTTDNFLDYYLAIERFTNDVYFRELPLPVNKTDWTHHSYVTTVNAYYSTVENSIQLPAGILQSPLFSADRPNYMNYGSIGFAIGHEITHGFDDVGRQYDKDGSLNDWWAEKTKEAFVEKAQCIIDQYGNFTAPEVNMNLNGATTQGENIADNGGVKEAYLAYNSWAKRNGDESRLPGLQYTPRQLFWISTANLWCATQKTEFLQLQVLTDAHSPPNFRVLGPLRNTEYFSRDFKCPVGSNMNPVHKCQVW
ncbi:hypothetical protein ILUMI_03845 [Ignelater luminosus]|uniref:Uncharacterized protein n=1 Tax=Ignelater luminosus TaxID=2038154 RepID=A0A8K0GF45_IGNLU|nr:hypothetical protein ILUMI_03845 [Ignelater luminosus]